MPTDSIYAHVPFVFPGEAGTTNGNAPLSSPRPYSNIRWVSGGETAVVG